MEVEVGGKPLRLSNLDKVLYPAVGFTKGQVIDYYTRIAPVLLPHLRDRPLTLKRYPNGVDEKFFYEKQAPSHRPDWVKTVPVPARERTIDFALANDLPTLVWLANLADLELHTSLSLAQDIQRPTHAGVRPRPGSAGDDRRVRRGGAAAARAVRDLGARELRQDERLEGDAALRAAQHEGHLRRHQAVRQGARRAAGQAATRTWSCRVRRRSCARARCSSTGARTTSTRRRSTSTRCARGSGRPSPRRSPGTRWRRWSTHGDPESAVFDSDDVLKRVEEHGDLFEPVVTLKQKLPKL